MNGSLTYVEGDLFQAIDKVDRATVIAHVCNNKGRWGAGFVVSLGKKYPHAREAYIGSNLGDIQMVLVNTNPNIYVCNMIAQTLGGKRPLYYNHLSTCMDSLVTKMNRKEQIYAPRFGAGLAGGDWRVIEALIYDCWIRAGIDVTIFHLPWQQDLID